MKAVILNSKLTSCKVFKQNNNIPIPLQTVHSFQNQLFSTEEPIKRLAKLK